MEGFLLVFQGFGGFGKNGNVVLADFPVYPFAVTLFEGSLDSKNGAIEIEPWFGLSVFDWRVIEAPFCFKELEDASSMRTTSAPF